MNEPEDGFEGIRWTDAIDSIAARFPDRVRQSPSYEGRNPRTGERVYVGPGIWIDDLPKASVRLTTLVSFDEAGIRDISVRVMPVSMLGWGDAEWDRFADAGADVLRELARRLRITEVSMELEHQTWTVDDVEIVLEMGTGPAEFTLMIRRPR